MEYFYRKEINVTILYAYYKSSLFLKINILFKWTNCLIMYA